MEPFKLITQDELVDFAAALKGNGWQERDFELQEDVFDPRTAEVEAFLRPGGYQMLSHRSSRGLSLGSRIYLA
jgi:hypothetical protein